MLTGARPVNTALPRLSRGSFFASPRAGLLAVLVLAALVYWPGLNGPFLFDDPVNLLIPMRAWLAGDTGWQEIVFGNRSGLLGRPLSMLTFAANAALTGLDVAPFKATNLAIHLLCGTVLYALLARLLRRDPFLATRASAVALLCTSVWLLHPMQVSTVLYVVQRMAQLSALFTLLALLCYVVGRQAIEEGRNTTGRIALFVLLPIATVAAMFSKENGVLVPLLCGVIELGYFRDRSRAAAREVRLFFILFLALPLVAALVRYGLHPGRMLQGYDGRLFTLGERLLSQPRAIMDYLGALLLPRGPSLGVYTDDFPISHSLLAPPETLWALLGLAALIACALLSRKRIPALFTGLSLYLTGHALESTVFPLELYFEHRNYLPSFGVFLAGAGLGAWAIPKLLRHSTQPRRLQRMLGALMAVFVALLASATWARSGVWSSWASLAEQGVQQHPRSRRAHLDHISMLLAQSRNDEALRMFAKLGTLDDPAARHAAAMGTVWHQCRTDGRTDPDSVARIAAIAGEKLELAELLSAEKLANLLLARDCEGLSKTKLALTLRELAGAAGQPDNLTQIWRLRLMASRLFMADEQLALATEQAALAWMPGTADAAAGVFLANLYYLANDRASARLIARDVSKRMAPWDQRNRKLLDDMQQHFDAAPSSGVAADTGVALPSNDSESGPH